MGSAGPLRKQIWHDLHTSGLGSHSGIKATIKRVTFTSFDPLLTRTKKLGTLNASLARPINLSMSVWWVKCLDICLGVSL